MTKQLEKNAKEALARREKFQAKAKKFEEQRKIEEAKRVAERDLIKQYWSIAYLDLPSHMTDEQAMIFTLGMDMARAVLNGDEEKMFSLREEMSAFPLYLNL